MFVIFKHCWMTTSSTNLCQEQLYDCQHVSDMSANCPDWCTMICFLFACPVRQLLWPHVGAPAESCKQRLLWCQLSDVVTCCQWCQVCDVICEVESLGWAQGQIFDASCQWCQMFDLRGVIEALNEVGRNVSWCCQLPMMPDVWWKLVSSHDAWISI